MHKITAVLAVGVLLIELSACTVDGDTRKEEQLSTQNTETIQENETEGEVMPAENIFYLMIGETTLTASFTNNSSAEAFKKLLENESLTLEMSDYGNFEKVGNLGYTLPKNDEFITTKPGDIILYQGNTLTIYYDQNSWNFTRIGKISDITKKELMEILGSKEVVVTFSLAKTEQ